MDNPQVKTVGVTCSKGSSYWSWLTIHFAMLSISLLIFRHFNQVQYGAN